MKCQFGPYAQKSGRKNTSITDIFTTNCQNFIKDLATKYSLVFLALSVTIGRNICATVASVVKNEGILVYQNRTGRIMCYCSDENSERVSIV